MKQYDTIIIGFGKCGKTLAAALGNAGRQVAVVEQSAKMYGGTCINVGCIPSKSLVNSAGHSALLGGGFAEKAERYRQAIAEKERLTDALREKNYQKLAANPHIDVITGKASFTGPERIRVETAQGAIDLSAPQFLINTGARPFVPNIPGLENSRRVYLSETLLDLEALPERLIIIGGGYIGMEFASIYTNFGARVTVIQNEPDFLPREDHEIAQAVLESLQARGVTVLLNTEIESVTAGEDCDTVHIRTAEGEKALPAEAILVATGRRPNTQGLNLQAAGVALNERGAIQTDEFLRTSAPHIWAAGDVTGGLQFTYISLDDYRIIRDQMLGESARTTQNRGAVPYSVFLDPPFSRVGLSEQQAREQGYAVKIARLPAAAIPKAQVLRKTTGLLKAVVDAETDEILGAHLFCSESHEMINLLKLAMDAHLPYPLLRDAIYTHPTMSEALNDLFAALA